MKCSGQAYAGDNYELVFLALDVRDVHVMGGRAKIFELLASEDIDCNEMDLRVAVLSGLGGTHFDDLAGAALDDDESVLTEGRALHRIGGGGTGIGALKGVLMLLGKLVSPIGKESTRAHAPDWRGTSGGALEQLYLGIVGLDLS